MSTFDTPIVWTDGKWERRDYPTIMDGLVVRYRQIGCYGDTEISASRNQVIISGPLSFNSAESWQYYQDIVERCLKLHFALARGQRDNLPLVDPRPSEDLHLVREKAEGKDGR